jgi:bifunctional UDP-N-acetylglucosamine pyrophosphorylase/glucosamine-1-phosphate N-acetyltransferase
MVIGLEGTISANELRRAGADAIVPDLMGLLHFLASTSAGVRAVDWTVIIPAAGRGTRLGFDKPKILYPVAGKMILEWLLDLFLPLCSSVVLVVAPDGRNAIEAELQRLARGRYRIAVQDAPTGMGDAVGIGLGLAVTKHVAVVWGDQVALRKSSVEGAMRLHEGPLSPAITVPTVWRPDPYIHFPRDASGEICGLLQAREGDSMPAEGESDTGFFCFDARQLRDLLSGLRSSRDAVGRRTGELNLLPLIPRAARAGRGVATPQLVTLEETVGVNSAADALQVEGYLRNSR